MNNCPYPYLALRGGQHPGAESVGAIVMSEGAGPMRGGDGRLRGAREGRRGFGEKYFLGRKSPLSRQAKSNNKAGK